MSIGLVLLEKLTQMCTQTTQSDAIMLADLTVYFTSISKHSIDHIMTGN